MSALTRNNFGVMPAMFIDIRQLRLFFMFDDIFIHWLIQLAEKENQG